jgi:lipopolysaccharide/colanic/teichoic acid biosynthesis glycosyltransferase
MQTTYITSITGQPASCSQTFAYRVIKRLIDVLGSAFALIFLSPLLVLIALAVRLSSPGPVFYKWHVVGRGGNRFTGYKFRTMVVNADDLKKDLWQHNERNGPTFKMKEDPRVTPLGRILRKFSLDELPQLWSVLKGDMSLVGPRPVGPDEWERFQDWQRRKLSVTPGGVCLWHARGKPEGFNEWIRLDLEYIDNWSLWLDIKIICGGVWYILSGKNY